MKKIIQTILILFVSLTLDGPLAFAQTDFDILMGAKPVYRNIEVVKVISADTIILENDERFKLIGLKAPEPPESEKNRDRDKYGFKVRKDSGPMTTLDVKAYEFAVELLEGKKVSLKFDIERRNEKEQSLAYVFLLEDNTFANAEILRLGFANLSVRPPNTKYAHQLRAAHNEAKKEKRGLQGQ